MRKKLPEGFQRAGFLLEKGFADDIIERKEHKKYLTRVLRLHGG
jgi:acetyl-CoA carboxylase carboxyl transferase subunit beta